VLDEKLTAPGHDNMRLDDLRRRPAERRGGGRFHIGGGLEAVPPEHHDLVPGPGQQQPGEQARGTAPSDGDVQFACSPASSAVLPPGTDTRVKRQDPHQQRRTRASAGTRLRIACRPTTAHYCGGFLLPIMAFWY